MSEGAPPADFCQALMCILELPQADRIPVFASVVDLDVFKAGNSFLPESGKEGETIRYTEMIRLVED